uniref:AttH domain-containing protein n=1 Tax=Paramoeba aestuarina TaxID=180227 RepID=A0A7S4UV70_9EUKA
MTFLQGLKKVAEFFFVISFCCLVWIYSLFFGGKNPKGVKLAPVGGGVVKRVLAFLFIGLGRWFMSWKEGTNVESHEKRMLSPKKIVNHNDSWVFFGYDSRQMLLARVGFRGNGKTEVWLTFFTEKYGKMKLQQEIGDWPDSFESISSNSLTFSPVIIGEKWKIQYSGPMKCENDGTTKMVNIDFVFTSNSGIYHTDKHLDSLSLSTAMSAMDWSRSYFQNLRSQNQKRIENGGIISGTYTVDGHEEQWNALSIRDHSWGTRDWRFIHRYIWILVSFPESVRLSGVTIRHMCFTTVNYGTFSSLVGGWISGEGKDVFPIVEATPIEEVGENGEIPTSFVVHFRPKCSPLLSLHCHREEERMQNWVVGEGKFEVVETHSLFSLSSFSGEASVGEKGVGMVEFGYSSRYPRAVFHSAEKQF